LLAQRYERRSTIITGNLPFSEWVKVFGDESSHPSLDRLEIMPIRATRGASYRNNKRRRNHFSSRSAAI